MRVFLDECIDWRLSRDIVGHDVKTARQMGWTTVKNGELLTLVAGAFDIFVTVDRNLAFQQNIGIIPIVVIVLRAKSNRLDDLRARPKAVDVSWDGAARPSAGDHRAHLAIAGGK